MLEWGAADFFGQPPPPPPNVFAHYATAAECTYKKWYIRSWPWYTNMRIFGPLVALICLAVNKLSASEEGRHFSIFQILFSLVITYFNRFWYLIFFTKSTFSKSFSCGTPVEKRCAGVTKSNEMNYQRADIYFLLTGHRTYNLKAISISK